MAQFKKEGFEMRNFQTEFKESLIHNNEKLRAHGLILSKFEALSNSVQQQKESTQEYKQEISEEL